MLKEQCFHSAEFYSVNKRMRDSNIFSCSIFLVVPYGVKSRYPVVGDRVSWIFTSSPIFLEADGTGNVLLPICRSGCGTKQPFLKRDKTADSQNGTK